MRTQLLGLPAVGRPLMILSAGDKVHLISKSGITDIPGTFTFSRMQFAYLEI